MNSIKVVLILFTFASILFSADMTKLEKFQTYLHVKKFARMYDVPEKYALRIIHAETNFSGVNSPYNPNKISSHGACGAMQILPATASAIWGNTLTRQELVNNTPLNIKISMMYLKHLYDRYGCWKKAISVYNQGPKGARRINAYARRITR